MSTGSGRVGPWLATVLVAGNMVGSGIFLLPASVAGIGSFSMLGWLVATGGAVVVALALARLTSVAPLAGGPCAYAHEAHGRYFGFQSYVLYLIICWVGNLGVAVAAIGYLAALFPVFASGWISTLGLIGLYALMTLLNIVGPRLVCQFDGLTMLAGLLPIALVATLGWTRFDPALFRASWNPSGMAWTAALPQSVLLVFWAFLGLESAAVAAAVVVHPERNVARATIGGVLLAAVVYIASSAVIFGLVPADALARSTAPFADATRVLLGPVAAGLVAIAALIKTVGTLSGWILVGAQTSQAAAAAGFLPRSMADLDRRGVPVRSLLVGSLVTCLMAVATRSATLARQFELLAEASVLMTLLVYIYALLALWRMAPARRATGTGYRTLGVIGIGFCAAVIAGSPANLLWLFAALLAVTVPAYALWVRPRSG